MFLVSRSNIANVLCLCCVHTHIGMSVGTTYPMHFHFCRVYIARICNFRDFSSY